MRRNQLPIAGLILVCGLSASAAVPDTTPDVRVGARGYGLSDFGTEKGIERFGVEILGILKNIAPRQDAILARLSGPEVEKSGVIAGMSGSPVYIDGRLIGAVAFGWPFAHEPIAGITPVDSMMRLRDASERGAAAASPLSRSEFVEAFRTGSFAGEFRKLVDGVIPRRDDAAGLKWLPLPISVSAGAEEAPLVAEVGRRLGMINGGGRSTSESAKAIGTGEVLPPGSSVAAVLVSGDLDFAATGTVTWSDGKEILAFGHPFLSLGSVSFPMATSRVLAILPSVMQSFKIATSGDIVGSIVNDRSSGISGRFGSRPRTIPLRLGVSSVSGGSHSYHFEIVEQPLLTPILAAIAVDATLTSRERSVGERTIVWKSSIETNAGFVRFDSVFSGASAREQATGSLALLTSFLMSNDFQPVEIRGIDVAIEHRDRASTIHLRDATLAQSRVRPGKILAIDATLDAGNGDLRHEIFQVPIPPETPPGPLAIFVGDGTSATSIDLSAFPSEPDNLAQAIQFLARIRPANTLNVCVYRASGGVVLRGQELAKLPPSMGTVLAEPGLADVAPILTQSRVAMLSREEPAPISGTARLSVMVIQGSE